MKVLITLEPNINKDNFESSRLCKSIRGALELADISHTSSDLENYDIAHLISVEEDALANEVIEKGKPLVVSALMCENDPDAAYLDFKYKDGVIENTLSSKALKYLNKASRVLVPCESARLFLKDNKVVTDITVLPPGVNLSTFDFEKQEEKELF